jgi:uncharacterized protein (DUF486 family)
MNYFLPAVLLTISNAFMTFAWYGHLRYGASKPLWMIVLASWGIAFFEYCFMIPANHLGSKGGMSAGQLKVMQEAITMGVFLLFARFYLMEKLSWNFYVGFGVVLVGVVVAYADKL